MRPLLLLGLLTLLQPVEPAEAQTLSGKFFKNSHGKPFRFMRTEDTWTVVEVA